MKFNKIMILFLSIMISFLIIGAVSAEDASYDNLTNCESDDISQSVEVSSQQANDEALSTQRDLNDVESDSEVLGDSSPKTWTIGLNDYKDKADNNPNQVLSPSIQKVIDQASPGDTIVLAYSFVHCHFVIDKPLHIKVSRPDITIGPCPHHTNPYSETYGVFAITPNGTGTTIEGFTFLNDFYSIAYNKFNPFAVYVDGASDVTIKDCVVNWTGVPANGEVPEDYLFDPFLLNNTVNTSLINLYINNVVNGITLINASNTKIENSVISNARNYGIVIGPNTSNTQIVSNELSKNNISAIDLESADHVYILSNVIKNNKENGIFVNSNITKIEIKGNVFVANGEHAVLDSWRVLNMDSNEGDEYLQIIDNNYFTGHKGMIIHHDRFYESEKGSYIYNATTDSYDKVDYGKGNYELDKAHSYMINAYLDNEIVCGFTFYDLKTSWSLNPHYLSFNLSQVKKGVYKFSIVDEKGNIASDFNSFYVTFFFNDFTTVEPQEGDIYKKVLVQNGVATADFNDVLSSISESDVVTVSLPGTSSNVKNNPYVQSNISSMPKDETINPDDEKPVLTGTVLTASKLTTYPVSDAYFKVKLTDADGKAIAGEKLTVKFNGKSYTVKTDNSGIAKVKVSLTSKKTYAVSINYVGNLVYKSVSKSSSIVVKTGTKKSKITASAMTIKKNKNKVFKFKLTNSAGKALKSQKVIVKLNGKTYTVKTASNGYAKLTVKLSKVKTYSASIKYLGNSQYKAVSKTVKIKVTK